MKKLILIATLVLSGCSVMQPIVNKSAEETAKLVDKYCEELSEDSRLEIRNKVNSEVSAGNSIEIKCADKEG